jgi:hypothetical protein
VIFGYNTEIRLGDTLYHVQSEARDGERLLATEVFVKGRCISKRSTPSEHDKNAQSVQECLRLQHRSVVESIRAGQLDLAPAGPPTVGDEAEATEPNLSLRCTSARREGAELVLDFQLTRAGAPVPDVKLRCSLIKPDGGVAAELVFEPVTDGEGIAGLRIAGMLPVNAELQVELEGEKRKTLRRFRLRQRENR